MKVISFGALLLAGLLATGEAAETFSPRELFQIPFGSGRDALGAGVEGGNFQYPRDFTMDGVRRVYIFDTRKHRIVRYSPVGQFEMGLTYPATAEGVFAHPDSRMNLWLLVSDPTRGVYCGVYDPQGKRLHEAVFGQYDRFETYPDDDGVIHVILSSRKKPKPGHNFIFHEASLTLKPLNIAPPPEDHHELRTRGGTYYIDTLPGAAKPGAPPVQRITDAARNAVGQIQGDVIYITSRGEIYTRIGDCQIQVYSADGSLQGRVTLPGLPSTCRSIRFGSDGAIYQLDGIPDASRQYTPQMPGMRLIGWERG